MKGFFEKLVKACPSLPFLALGVWLAWAYIACSGTAWLSDTEMNGANISTMYIVFTLTFGIVLLASTFRAARIRQLLELRSAASSSSSSGRTTSRRCCRTT